MGRVDFSDVNPFSLRPVVQTPDGDDLADVLIAAGLGHAYDGAARASWCVGAKAG